MEQSAVMFVFGTLLSVIGFLIVVYIKQLASRLDSIDTYIKLHDAKFLEQELKHFDTRERIHNLINEEIVPLKLAINKLEEHFND